MLYFFKPVGIIILTLFQIFIKRIMVNSLIFTFLIFIHRHHHKYHKYDHSSCHQHGLTIADT